METAGQELGGVVGEIDLHPLRGEGITGKVVWQRLGAKRCTLGADLSEGEDALEAGDFPVGRAGGRGRTLHSGRLLF